MMCFKGGKPDAGMMVNGMLAGLVAITAPCAFVHPWAAAVIGLVAAVIVIEAVCFIERRGHRRSGRRNRGARRRRHVRRAVRRHLRQRQVRRRLERLRRSPASRGHQGRASASSVRRRSASLTIWTVIFGIAFGFFKIQNKLMKGGIRPDEADGDRGHGHARDGRLRIRRRVTFGLLAPFVPGHCARGRMRFRADRSGVG